MTCGGGPALVAASFLAGWGLTGWPAAGAIVGASAGVVPMLVGLGERRRELNARTEALASWAEMLRDSISSHAGLREAISVTARVAPLPIRTEVQELAVRAEREPLPDALRRFGAQVDDPLADLIVASMIIAADRQAQRLADLLTQIASAAREMSAMRLRVETGRARTYTSSKVLVMFTFGLAVTLMLFAPDFMAPYDTATGQVVMVGIGGLFCAALWSLVALGRPARRRHGSSRRDGGGLVMVLAMIARRGMCRSRSTAGRSRSGRHDDTARRTRRRAPSTPTRRRHQLRDAAKSSNNSPAPTPRTGQPTWRARTVARQVSSQDRLTWSLLGAAPGLALLALAATGSRSRLLTGCTHHRRRWRDRRMVLRAGRPAQRRREGATRVPARSAAYLELVTILMAGGAGVETALFDAASAGHGPHVPPHPCGADGRSGSPPADRGCCSATSASRLGVSELVELHSSMTLAGDGAQVRNSLGAMAAGMRRRDLAQIETEAQSKSEAMVLPVALMFAGFLILIGYPALAALSTT